MMYPSHHGLNAVGHIPVRKHRAVNHDHRQPQTARGNKLRFGTFAARILRNNMRDAMRGKQRLIFRNAEGAARDNGEGVWQRKSAGRVRQPQQIVMMRGGRERRKVLLPDGEKNSRRRLWKSRDGRFDIRHALPLIFNFGSPGCALESEKRNPRDLACGDRVPAHLRREWMRRIDDLRDRSLAQIAGQPLSTTKATDPRRKGLRLRQAGASGIREHSVHPSLCKDSGQTTGFRCAAQKEDACHD